MQLETTVALREPSAWQIVHQTPFIVVERDRLTAKYSGPGNQHQDAGSVRSNVPFAADKLVDYFEIQILAEGKNKTITIGIGTENFIATKLPGWDTNSYGYHADGKKYTYGKQGKAYGPTFSQNDIIGCGIYYFKKEVFFTKNGKYLGPAFTGIASRKWFPCVGLNSPGEAIRVNFGSKQTSIDNNSSLPFVFDIHNFMDEEQAKLKSAILQTPPPSVNTINSILASYFLHSGFGDTLAVFQKYVSQPSMKIPPKMHERKQLNALITSGNVKDAIQLLITAFPDVYEKLTGALLVNNNNNNKSASQSFSSPPVISSNSASVISTKHPSSALIKLHCQSVIELVRSAKIQEALEYVLSHISAMYSSPLLESDSEEYKILTDTVALLAYENPFESPINYLFNVSQRDAVAHELNQVIVESQGLNSASILEQLLIQLDVCKTVLFEESTGVDNVLSL